MNDFKMTTMPPAGHSSNLSSGQSSSDKHVECPSQRDSYHAKDAVDDWKKYSDSRLRQFAGR